MVVIIPTAGQFDLHASLLLVSFAGTLLLPPGNDNLAQLENNARGRDQGGSSKASGSTRQARAGGRESRQAAPSTDELADGGVGNNNASKTGGAGSSAGASAGARADASVDTVGGDGPSTTMDEDLALVSFFKEVFMYGCQE